MRAEDSASAEEPAIDLTVLRRSTLGRRDLEIEVLQLFAEHLPVPLAMVRSDAAPKDWAYATHTIKGAARSVGALRLAAAAAAAEKAPVDAWGRHTDDLHREARAAVAFVTAVTAEPGSPDRVEPTPGVAGA